MQLILPILPLKNTFIHTAYSLSLGTAELKNKK